MIWIISSGVSLVLFIVFTITFVVKVNKLKAMYNNEDSNDENVIPEKFRDYKYLAIRGSIILLFLLIPLGYLAMMILPSYDVTLFQNIETIVIGLSTMSIFCFLNYILLMKTYEANYQSGGKNR